MKPNLINIARLITALRSGTYHQGIGRLKTIKDGVNYHCCLGVACELVLGPHDHESYWEEDLVHTCFWQSMDTMPPEVINVHFGLDMKKLELEYGDGFYGKNLETAHTLNDRRVSFAVIADAIESKYLPIS